MKKWRFLLPLLLAAVMLLLPSCKKIVEKDGMYYDKSQKIYYTVAPWNYEPVNFSSEEYNSSKTELGSSFRTVTGLDPKLWLYDDTNHQLVYSTSITLPSLTEMKPHKAVICRDTDTASVGIDELTEAGALLELVTAATKPTTQLKKYPATPTYQNFKLRFASELYPSLYYCVSYIEYANDVCEYEDTDSLEGYTYRQVPDSVRVTTTEKPDGGYEVCYNYGRYFVYDRERGLCAAVGDAIHRIVGEPTV